MLVGDIEAIGVDVDVPVEVNEGDDELVDVLVDELDAIAPELSCPRFAFTPHAACVSTLITYVHPDGLTHPDEIEKLDEFDKDDDDGHE